MNEGAPYQLSTRFSFSAVWGRLDPALRTALVVYLAARTLISVWAAAAVATAPVDVPYVGDPVYETIHEAYPHSSPLLDRVLGVWFRWDTGWFNKVAIHGYDADDGSVTVSPLYPLLIRWLGVLLGGEYLLASLIISNLAFAVALALLYKLVGPDYGDGVARWTLVLLVALPAGFFFLAGYNESLFLLLAVLSLYAARTSRWPLAGAAAFLATMARMQGWVLALPLGYEALRQAREGGAAAWRGLLAAAGAPLATVLYNLCLAGAGLPGMAETYRGAWYVSYAPPWVPIAMAVQSLLAGRATLQDILNLLAVVLSVGLIMLSVRRLRPSYWLYSAALQLVFLMGYLKGEQLHSMIRYTLVLFPNAVVLVLAARQRWLVRALVLAVFIPLQLLLLWMFVRWIWVA